MLFNREGGPYSPEQEAALVSCLKQADSHRSPYTWGDVIFHKIKPYFGLYFAEIERLCRIHNLTMHMLAVPARQALEERYDFLVVDPNDMRTFRPYVAMNFELGLDQLLDGARLWRISYDPMVNMAQLRESGIYTPKSGSKVVRSTIDRIQ